MNVIAAIVNDYCENVNEFREKLKKRKTGQSLGILCKNLIKIMKFLLKDNA